MNREQAKELIRDTFESPFNKEKFVVFIKNLLNKIEEKPFVYQGNYIPDAFKPYINRLERIGKYSHGENEIDLLIVKLKKESSLERARTMQRNFIAWYLKGSRGGKLKDASLVAFVSPDEDLPAEASAQAGDWRFSLVKMEYRFEEINGSTDIPVCEQPRTKVREEFTPARRWSFLVGKNEKSHTAQSRLVSILEDDEHNPTLAQLEEAFNIEPVTKEFFDKYRDLLIRTVNALDNVSQTFLSVKNDFESKNINTVDFAKKLLGQIVFLYFLQKKGWFGVKRDAEWGTGAKDFLRRLFNKEYGDYKNFFNDILEPLFYEALARERDDNFYSRFNCKIPFLNGGLFEPIGGYDWVHTDILLPDDLFSNSRKTPEGDIGDGILDVFDRFNFTVKEDEPLEKEVAIDPELLGKLYEKFNAIRPDNFYEYKKALASGKRSLEKQFNKKFGVYYTPREIVHYMCQQSLIYYLESNTGIPACDIEKLIKFGEQFTENETTALIKERRIREGKQETSNYELKLPESIRKNAKLLDDKLRDIKICDPAIGSGAFLVGMMHEIVKTRNVLSAFINNPKRSIYNFKREGIENSLYGVDIDAGACEVAKLRLWLSLIVDEEEIRKIKPLPNLDYKIMQGNSLISEFLGINLDSDEDKSSGQLKLETKIDSLIRQFQEKKNKFLNESDRNKKEQLRYEIENLIINIFEEKLRKQKSNYFYQLKYIEEKCSKLPNEEQRNKYITEEKEKLYKRTGFNLGQIEKQLKEYTSGNKTRPFFPWRLYFAEVFYGKDGFDVVIANPPYVRQEKIKDQKTFLQKAGYEVYNSTSDLYTYFYEKSWKILKPDGFSCFISSNKWMRAKYGENLRRFFKKKTEVMNLIDFGGYPVFEATVDTNIILFKKRQPDNKHKVRFVSVKNDLGGKDLISFLEENYGSISQKKFDDKCWTLADERVLALKEKIERIGKPLKDWDVKIYRGVLTGFNEAFIITTEKQNEILSNCKTKVERKRTEQIIKPVLRGRDIGRYYYRWARLWVIIIETGWTNKNRGRISPEKYFRDTYPAIYQHLTSFKNYKGKGKGMFERDDQGDYWWELRHCAYYPEFEKEKIVWQEMSNKPSFGLDVNNLYTNQTVYIATGKNLKYITAFLNSKIAYFYLRQIAYSLSDNANRWIKQYVELIPLPPITPQNQHIAKELESLVNKILSLTQSEDYLENTQKQARVKEYERQIDQSGYKLYELTEEEIKIVEEKER